MENNIRFRNHISVVLEQLGMVSGILFVLLLTNADDVVELLENGTLEELNLSALIGGGVIFGILVLTCLYQLILWAKTYISVCDNSIVIERNTINKKKNTIGIKNISNVNTEQNLFEMLLGTCKVKLDTNSMSTAEQTDVKIVLKKADAEQFKRYVMKQMLRCKGEQIEEEQDYLEEKIAWDLEAEPSDIVAHGFLSINIFSVLIAVGSFVGVVGMIMAAVRKIGAGESLLGMILSFIMAAGIGISAIQDIAKGFIRYYGFKIARNRDELQIRYGLFKKVNYTIPIGKINGVIIRQSLIARMTGRYMAEIINIGMGDDAAEAEAFLFPYCKRDVMSERLKYFLPEFEHTMKMDYRKQTVRTWVAWLWPTFLYLVFGGASVAAGIICFPEYQKWIGVGTVLLSAWILILATAYYFTSGSGIGKDNIILVKGYFGKTYCFLTYKNIQYIELKQSFLARFVKLQKGEIHLLASAKNRVQSIPYFPQEDGEVIKERMLVQ